MNRSMGKKDEQVDVRSALDEKRETINGSQKSVVLGERTTRVRLDPGGEMTSDSKSAKSQRAGNLILELAAQAQ